MPFVAKSKATGERIDITRISNPRLTLKAGDCVCQLCDEPLIIKAGQIVAAHFAHYRVCTTDYKAHPESAEHRAAKLYLMNALARDFAEYSTATIELEVRIPEVMRVADLLAVFPMGWRVAHEIQLASITVEELKERTADYGLAGIDVVWWLGKNADTPANINWCKENFGFSLSIDTSFGN